MGVIYKKELKGYFTGMMGYVFIAFALAVIGIYTVAVNFIQSYPNFEYVLDSIRFLFLLLIPILTMRTMSDEKRQRTDLLLYSSPISTYSIILGKFFAALTVFAVPFAVSCFYPLIIGRYGVVNYKVAYSAIFGFVLMGGACIAIGIFLSSLTESQMVSAVLCFGALLLCYLMPSLSSIMPSSALSSLGGFLVLAVFFGCMINITTKNKILSIALGGLTAAVPAAVYLIDRTALEGTFNTAMNAWPYSPNSTISSTACLTWPPLSTL